MVSPSLDCHKVDHLYLLVGENPLPNLVAACCLVNPGGMVTMVHTSQTTPIAQNLKSVLTQIPGCSLTVRFLPLGNDQANSFKIRQAIQTTAQAIQGSIGMNYTGGTKAMAVHAYSALQQIRPEAIFSYLDPRLLQMFIDRPHDPPLQYPVDLSLKLDQILALHGLTWWPDSPPFRDPVHPELATQLAALLVKPEFSKSWQNWRRKKVDPLKTACDNQKTLTVQSISLDSLAEPLQDSLAQHFNVKDNHLQLSDSCAPSFDHPCQLLGWLHGLWLEDFVLATIRALAPQYSIHDYGLSLQIQNPQQRQDPFPQFELDVAFTKGYQLFAISCTTAQDKATCKKKLFEATQRARQLGGAEARIGLVCGHRRPHLLQSELELVTRNRKLKVFGIPQWGTLDHHIAEWIRHNA